MISATAALPRERRNLGTARPEDVGVSPATPRARRIHGHGYRLTRAGLVDMFPHTSHIESVTGFESCESGGSAHGSDLRNG